MVSPYNEEEYEEPEILTLVKEVIYSENYP
jgi:hypothetical protein